jgi:hypothetical protein
MRIQRLLIRQTALDFSGEQAGLYASQPIEVATYCRFCEAAASANRTKPMISYLGEGTLYVDFDRRACKNRDSS